MAIKKTRFKPPVYDTNGTASYPNTIHFETSADLVQVTDTAGKLVATNVEDALQEVFSNSEATDLKNVKTYKYSLQMSADGLPQIKFEEV